VDRQVTEISQRVSPPERDRLLLELEALRAQRNAEFNRALLRAGCPLPTTTTSIVPTSTTSIVPTTTTTTTPADRCAQIVRSRQAFNAQIDAQVINILQNTPPQLQAMALSQLEQMRASGNAEFDRQLAANQCSTTTTTTTTTTPNRCGEIRESREAFNADIDARAAAAETLDPRVRVPILARLEAERAAGNAEFDRQLALAGCGFGFPSPG
jgi:hypothetical protein